MGIVNDRSDRLHTEEQKKALFHEYTIGSYPISELFKLFIRA
jgi:hypothetical protein